MTAARTYTSHKWQGVQRLIMSFFSPSVKKRKIEMIVESRPSVKVLQKVIERMKNAPILGFHCVARKLK